MDEFDPVVEALEYTVTRFQRMAEGAQEALKRWQANPVPETLAHIHMEVADAFVRMTEDEEALLGPWLEGMEDAVGVAEYSKAFAEKAAREQREQEEQ